ncbi:dTMP kinase [Nakamurella leprariae]|uniref:dTMP kinase n=1 Tax=Nakamurella leprariae TaxID=2803911 RepID=UPI002E2A2382|nr:dTMP kinase [Nakamurella leprariae]
MTGRLVVLEGLDGAGKQTLTRHLVRRAEQAGTRIATLAFPRYGVDVHADLVREALYGRLGDLSDSVYAPAVLFALDRRAAAGEIRTLLAAHDLVLLDRYVASNAAYGAARLGAPDDEAAAEAFPAWVREWEIDRFDCPVPDHQLLLAPPAAVAADQARSRAEQTDDRVLDRFEADGGLQRRTGRMYARLAAASWLSPWTVLEPAPDRTRGTVDDAAAGPTEAGLDALLTALPTWWPSR